MKKTVLLLGAGASNHLSYPVGTGLIAQICKMILGKEIPKRVRDGYSEDDIHSFYMQLSHGGHSSIDAFLERYRDHIPLGKRFIVECLKAYEKEDELFTPNDAGWYKTLFDALKPSLQITPTPQTLSIITFNYDRSLAAC